MKTTLNTYDIANALNNDEFANWSRTGAFALAEYLEEYEESTGEELELDVIALRCDFTEFESVEDWADCHFSDDQLEELLEDAETMDEAHAILTEYVEERGPLIRFDGGIIVSQF